MSAVTPENPQQAAARKAALEIYGHKSEQDLRYWGSMTDEDNVSRAARIIEDSISKHAATSRDLPLVLEIGDGKLSLAHGVSEDGENSFVIRSVAGEGHKPGDRLPPGRFSDYLFVLKVKNSKAATALLRVAAYVMHAVEVKERAEMQAGGKKP